MPDRLVQGPDGIVHRFPADATDNEISAVLNNEQRLHGPIASTKDYGRAAAYRQAVNALIQHAPLVGGALGGMIGGPPGAAVGGAAGSLAKQVSNAATADNPEPTTPLGAATDVVANAVGQYLPQRVGAALEPAMKAGGTWLMQKAVKPTQALLEEYRTTGPRLAQTLLEQGVNVTRAGIAKLQALLGETNANIGKVVAEAPGTIDRNTVAARAASTADQFAKQVNPTADLEAIGNSVEEFLKHPIYKGPLSVADAQALKVGTYREIGRKYGEVSTAGIETQKALARGLKEEVAAKAPWIADLNLKDSELMAALDAVGRRVAVEGNKDPIGFAWVAVHRPETFLAALFDRSAAVKSLVARGLWAKAASAAGIAPQLMRAAVYAVASNADSAEQPAGPAGQSGPQLSVPVPSVRP